MKSLELIDVSPTKAKQFARKGIHSIEQLVRYLPRKYNDYSKLTGILPATEESCIVVTVTRVQQHFGSTPVISAQCTEVGSGATIKVAWFNQMYMYRSICEMINERVYVVGKASYDEKYKNYSIIMPSVFAPDIAGVRRIYPVYSKIPGMSENYLLDKLKLALSTEDAITETCPETIAHSQGKMPIKEAITELHAPSSLDSLKRAQERMVFDDLLYFSIRMESSRRRLSPGSQYGLRSIRNMVSAIKALPFTLTDDQKAALHDMTECMRSGKRINALLQGDVGSGKTIVAFLMMMAVADSGFQAALMAPTQVLARQHYDDLRRLVEPYGYNVAYFGGAGLKAKEKKELLAKLKSGEINMVVGTHALLNPKNEFAALALTITDEEHKFGVIQRESLTAKAASGVHSITMSATPIPRSLSMVLYGDEVQLLTIKTMPKGRMPIKTAVSASERGTMKFLLMQLEQGHQAYVVCPMIEKNEDYEDVKSVEDTYSEYVAALAPYGYKVGMLTGKSSQADAMAVIDDFTAMRTQVLVCTTVIEVGVNIPNATVIIINNAERFGLSGLHQLRGRVGRGNDQSYCVLMSKDKDNERLGVMVATTDGFKIAEEDLRIRGAGDFIGTKQSGDNKYMALMLAYPDEYKNTRAIASRMIDMGKEKELLSRIPGGDAEADD